MIQERGSATPVRGGAVRLVGVVRSRLISRLPFLDGEITLLKIMT